MHYSILYRHSAIINDFVQNQIHYTLLGRIKANFLCFLICFSNWSIISSAKATLPVNFSLQSLDVFTTITRLLIQYSVYLLFSADHQGAEKIKVTPDPANLMQFNSAN